MQPTSSDVALILSRRHHNGADFWAGPEGKIYVGNPFSTVGALLLLHELGVGAEHEAVAGAVGRVLEACRDDGRIRVGPRSPMYPCYTAEAARAVARFGAAEDPCLRGVADALARTTHADGGWRCSFSRFGKGPETAFSNPGATLNVLDFLRYVPGYGDDPALTGPAVETLLEHWVSRAPRGPCHWGIGSAFLQVEYPFLRYNLFYYVYVLSCFPAARTDPRFREAYDALRAKRDAQGRMVVERPHRRLGRLELCRRGRPSAAATKRFEEIEARVSKG